MERHGPVLPWSLLEQGFTFEGRRLHLANKARGIFWPADLRRGALSVKTTVPRGLRRPRYEDLRSEVPDHLDYCLQGEDPDSRDNRRLEQCREDDLPLIYLLGLSAGLYAPLLPVFVRHIDRTGLRAHLRAGDAWQPGLLQVHDPQRMQIHRGYRTREARARLHPAGFAALVLRAYDERCAICNLPRVQMLVEAAHIRPNCDELGLPVVNNGLALCTLHHRTFDAHLLGLRPDGVVQISPRLLAERDGPVLEHGIKAFHGRPLRSPLHAADQPGLDFLEWRWQAFLQAQSGGSLSP